MSASFHPTNDRTSDPVQTWMRMAKPVLAKSPILFCFPYSGAGASIFSGWVNNIPSAIVCPVEFPGHGLRMGEPLINRLTPMVEQLSRDLLPYLDQPFAFFGHSLGALLSFELARHLRDQHGLEPVHLFVSGHGAPQLEDQFPPIQDLPEEDFIAEIRKMNGTDEAVLQNRELLDVFLPILRADFAICGTYRYQPGRPLNCPITALGGLKDPDAPRSAMEAWGIHTTQPFKVRMFPGDHFYLTQNRLALLEILARSLMDKGA
jgi:surfactin synthase thioesterase subunit